MNIEEIREYCLNLKGVEESMPFDDSTLVFKVGNKMFALLSLDKKALNLKCKPELAIELREKHAAITEGWHMNKKHWNSLWLDEGLQSQLIAEQIDHSYNLVFSSLSKKLKKEIIS